TTDTDPTTDTNTTDTADTTTDTTDDGPFCSPGTTVCADLNNTQTCLEDGSAYGEPEPCAPEEVCSAGQCVSECEQIQANPSSVGCSFFATKHDNFYNNAGDPNQHDSLIAGNVSADKPVTAQLYFVPVNGNAEQAVGQPVMIPPKGTHTFVLTQTEIDSITTVRQGGVYRLETSRPVVAYQHSPLLATFTNDASMLLPEHALTGNYVVSSFPALIGPYPSYFTAIAITDGTVVDFTVKTGATAAGGGIPALAVNQSAQVNLNRYQLMNVVVQQQQGGDLSGTIVTADKPLHLVGAVECANVPNGNTFYCDHIEEAMLPLEYWGQEYVGAHAPKRGNEKFHWRVYAGEDGVTINTQPAQPGFPVVLNKGAFFQFQAAPAPNDSFVFTGDGPFLPVQYLEGQTGGGNTGDPSMIQSVPTEQFLDAYAFVTGTGYDVHYVQIIRPAGGADVYVDDVLVPNNSFYTVGNYEVADVSTSQGAHFANSEQPFGIVQVGYTEATSYGYPGGLKLEVINPQ
ncbi:MAG: hypothetical protein HC927_13405, partial [Deltaproteobacteria bacterium]|nr:hypothetical protein [Deltaproteobacteria bacterium]